MTKLCAECAARACRGVDRCSCSRFRARHAQSGNPIKVGVGLALTGAGAAPSKVIQTALEIWRDDVNAKGGLLGRPVQLVILDDQSKPANVPGNYTKLITVDKVDLLLGPYGTNFVAPAMPAIIQNNKMTISFTAIGINDSSTTTSTSRWSRSGRRASTPSRTASSSWRRRKIRSRRRSRSSPPTPSSPRAPPTARARRSRSTASRSSTTRAIRRRTTDFAPVMRAVQAANPDIVYHRRLSAGQRRHHPRRQRDRAVAQDVRRRDDRHAGDADQGAARAARERPDHRRELRRRARRRKSRRSADFLKRYSAQGRGGRHRSARLRLGTVRLRGRPGAGAGRDRDQEPRSRQARRIHAQGKLQDRGRRFLVRARTANGRSRARSGRRSRTRSRTTSISSATARRSRSSGRPSTRPAT